ncbi:hypothetical protein OAA27_02345, partial [bacterium]|nr:hypothetical protein [bacterium]
TSRILNESTPPLAQSERDRSEHNYEHRRFTFVKIRAKHKLSTSVRNERRRALGANNVNRPGKIQPTRTPSRQDRVNQRSTSHNAKSVDGTNPADLARQKNWVSAARAETRTDNTL